MMIARILARVEELLWNGILSENSARLCEALPDAEALYASLTDGERPGTRCWADIDYADQTLSTWRCCDHYTRMLQILKAFGKERLLNDRVFASAMLGALDYWLQHDFTNPNWWHNEIGVPRNLADLGLMLLPVMPGEMLKRLLVIVQRGSIGARPELAQKWTGANLIWFAMNTLRHGLLSGDEQLIALAARCAASEVCFGREGIQEDGSFFQHGPRLYSCGYGRSFSYEIAQLMYFLQNTPWQLSTEKQALFLLHVLDGQRWMTHGDSVDYAGVGREMVRPNALRPGILKSAVHLMTLTENLPRQKELRDWLAALSGGRPIEGTKYFPKASMLCHHVHGMYIGAKYQNDRIFGAEKCIGEGELCCNMSYGTHTCFSVDGTEYLNLMPVWDYARIPGTTARTETDAELLAHEGWWERTLPSPVSGGAQQGARAVIYQDASHDGVALLAACFAFEEGAVFLGAGVRCEEEAVTTLDQCRLQGDIRQLENVVIHHGIRYTRLEGPELMLKAGEAVGSWQRNHFAQSSKPVAEPVFLLTMRHEPGAESRYAYLVTPADTDAQVRVICNSREAQAIQLPDGKVMAVFHAECTVQLADRSIHGSPGVYIET